MDTKNLYEIYIYEIYNALKTSNRCIDNKTLAKIFEYYVCIKLSEQKKSNFLIYEDIDPNFKEENNMSHNDTGIDACDMKDTIVQCKLRSNTLSLRECATFFSSQVIYDENSKNPIIRWKNMILARNEECKLSRNFAHKNNLFQDVTFKHEEIVGFCENLLVNKPVYPVLQNVEFKLRDYQLDCIKLVREKQNVVLSLPTGTGKNAVIIYSMDDEKHYLILVPLIILMEQIYKEILEHKPYLKPMIQLIGNGKNGFDESKRITICVYNSVGHIKKFGQFNKIFVDEAHNINKPEIYMDYDESSEDEVDERTYKEIIRGLSEYDNNVYLSATIDEIEDWKYYHLDVRDMIEAGYLCDYVVKVPIFSDNTSDLKICEYLVGNYRNIIVYCDSHKEGKKINELLNGIQNGISAYVDCNTSKNERSRILKEFNDSKILFLVNVRILVEGFNAPIVKGVCFLHLPSNKTSIIQIIGRALRLHPLKKIANIILPYEKIGEEISIKNMMRIIANNDKRISRSCDIKKFGGYVNFETVGEDLLDGKFKYDILYDSVYFNKYNKHIWMEMLEKVKNHMIKHKKRPIRTDRNNRKIAVWLYYQLKNYQNKEKIMKDNKIREIFEIFLEEYKEYLKSNSDIWLDKFQNLCNYINNFNKRPSNKNKYPDIKELGQWLCTQRRNYKKNKDIMKNNKIREIFEKFLEDYKEYLKSNSDIWLDKLQKLSDYINNSNKLPSQYDKNLGIKKMASWLCAQRKNYKKKKEIMKDDKIREIFEKFLEDYKEYLKSNSDIWLDKFQKLIDYINNHNKKPSENDKNPAIKELAKWLAHQLSNYKKKKQIMKDDKIREIFEKFLEDYKEYFKSNSDIWLDNFQKLCNYINNSNKRPSQYDKHPAIKEIAVWLYNQLRNHKNKEHIMKDDKIRVIFENFLEEYKEYFKTYLNQNNPQDNKKVLSSDKILSDVSNIDRQKIKTGRGGYTKPQLIEFLGNFGLKCSEKDKKTILAEKLLCTLDGHN